MERAVASAHVFRFGLFEADVARNSLTRNGVRVKIQEQPFRVLILLLEQPGEILTREELRQKLWPEGTYVDFDGSLNVILKKLRAALNDDSDNPRFIETVPRRGYRFIAPVTVDQSPSEVKEPPPAAGSAPEPVIHSASPAARPRFAVFRKIWPWATLFILCLALFLGWRYPRKIPSTVVASQRVIAVLPFSNEGAGSDFDYLRYAIANELVTDLTHTRSVSVRPFASTLKYALEPADPAVAGSQLGVSHVLAGGFFLDNKNLRVHMELVDVVRNQAVWQEEVTVSPQRLIDLHNQLATRAALGLLPAINVTGSGPDEMPRPKNEQALDLFLHSLTIPLDPAPNRLAIEKLERSVSLDSTYAPAWAELGWRYYIEYHYGNGGEAAVNKALQAYKRQSELDPYWPVVSTTIRVERGDLLGSYDQASEFLVKHSDMALAHYSMSYVLRYAGLLLEAGTECDKALAIDPGFNVFRSCATPFILTGDYQHARTYIHLDENSGFGAMMRMTIALRSGNEQAALAESSAASQAGFQFADLVRAYLNHTPNADLSKVATRLEADPKSSFDTELLYQNAEVLSFTGQEDAAMRQLSKAIQANYCSYPAMDKDPLFDPIRKRAEFVTLEQAGKQCQQAFIAHRHTVSATQDN